MLSTLFDILYYLEYVLLQSENAVTLKKHFNEHPKRNLSLYVTSPHIPREFFYFPNFLTKITSDDVRQPIQSNILVVVINAIIFEASTKKRGIL